MAHTLKLSTVLTGLDENPLKESPDKSSKDLTLGFVIANALMAELASDKEIKKDDKNRLFDIWFDYVRGKEDTKMSVDDLAIVDARVTEAYNQLISGQVSRLINGNKNV